MKNKLIRIISILLVFSVVLGVTATAQETLIEEITTVFEELTSEIITELTDPSEPSESTDPTEPSEPSDPTDPPEPTEPEEPTDPTDPSEPTEPTDPPKPTFDEIPGNTVVGRMYLCTEIIFMGHSWIYIESFFDGEMTVGCYTVEPYGSVSVGTFGVSRRDGGGLYYNVERYSAHKYGLRSANWVGKDITKDQLIKISNRIRNWNHWDPFLNCTFFAGYVWDTTSKKGVMPLVVIPVFIMMQTAMLGGNSDVEMQPLDDPKQCFKQKKTGGNATLVEVKESSLKTRIG